MNPVNFALRHPITMLMLVVGLIAGGTLGIFRMRSDIFPPFDLPQIYVVQNFNGMNPAQMEGLIVNQFELNFQYVSGVKSVESKSIQQIALIKLSFYPGTDMAQAMAEVVGQANRAQAFMPPGVLPPQIMRMDAGSLPVGYLVLTSETESLGTMADLGQQRIRPLLQANVPGTVGTAPFGSNVRSIVVKVDPQRLRSYNLTPDDIVSALTSGNVITPSGNLYIKDQMPLVPLDTMIADIQEFGKIPVRLGRTVYIRDVASIADGTDINFGYALVNGKRSLYIPIVKQNTASTLTVVREIHETMPRFKSVLPESVKISYEFDESPTVKEAIKSVAIEGLIGAVLTGLMILLFLQDWRSVLVVVFNIPLALLGSLFALWGTGNTINIMTLGGLALSIGMLVDEATVSIENIHVQMTRSDSLARAVERGSNETAVPRLLAMLCILSVFIPAFIMAEPVRSLFVPLALAVGFAMVSSYLLSSTVVPVLSVWLLKHHGQRAKPHDQNSPATDNRGDNHHESAPSADHRSAPQSLTRDYFERCKHGLRAFFQRLSPVGWMKRGLARLKSGASWLLTRIVPARWLDRLRSTKHGDDSDQGFFERFQKRFEKVVSWTVDWRRVVVPVYLAACALVLFGVGPQLGTELFPQVDSGEFVLRFRAPAGTNFELTREMWVRCLQVIDEEAGAGNVEISMGFAGQQAPNYAMNNMILFMRGPDDAQMRAKFVEGSGIRLDAFRERLRHSLPQRIVPWFAGVLEREGLPAEQARARARQITFGFEPGDIVSEVMSFGSPTPIEVVVASPQLEHAREHAQAIEAELRKISYLRDVQIQQTLDYPTIPIIIDRQKAGLSGITTKQIGDSVLVATSSSRMVARNFWQDPSSGVSYQVQIEVPTQRMDSAAQAENIPLEEVNPGLNLMLRDVARVGQGFMPGEYDRTSMQRYVSVTANVEGEDLGRAAKQIEIALRRTGQPPRGVHVETRGQIDPMQKMFESLGIGLVVAVCVILVMLTAYFQAWRSALISVGAVPGVLSGVILILFLTHTTLNIESFMGTIMCIGVSVSNSVMLVTFTARDWEQGQSVREAAVGGATERLRPILMTACAMIVGMVPMSLALEAGSQMEAPLGRAVIGGLLVSTFGTLLLLPPIFVIVMGERKFVSPSLHPDDGDSPHFDQAGTPHQEASDEHPRNPETPSGSQEHA